ncbi:Uma2 family endonuclease [Kamptonema animale CS-326]|jgi:Uma2 family endonuclease|uniref:Uma2 family endonuclease n=1 Tax=Kamptonema animale TaxID=92934 RepID=UPI00232BBBE3|nr:Uma2 family endonuclease [Kamptonema animale]MDB9510805.1 Uma2 family endonuclease [Kamptonema animale CS-326]
MLLYDRTSPSNLPTAESLPYSDETPVDSELQDIIPHLLKSILALIWANREDWFFGIDMAWYYDPNQPAIVPDGFLSLGVPRIKGENLRLSYVTWEENGIIPLLAIEVVSKTPGGEYKRKKLEYARLGVLYYVIYAPRRSKPHLTIYRLDRGKYQLVTNNPVWMPEIGLGIGSEQGIYEGIAREWLYWYDREGNRYPTEAEARLQAQNREQQQRQRAEQLAERLRALGIDPEEG